MLQKPQVLRLNSNIPAPTLAPVLQPDISWKVITCGITKGWNKKIESKEMEQYAYIGLSDKDYLRFTAWLNEVIIYLKSQKAILNSFKKQKNET